MTGCLSLLGETVAVMRVGFAGMFIGEVILFLQKREKEVV